METIEFRDGTKFWKEVEDIQYGCCGVGSNPTVSTNNKTIMGYYKICGTCHLCEDAYKAYLESGIYEPIRCTAMHGEMNIKIPIKFPYKSCKGTPPFRMERNCNSLLLS